MPGANRSNRAAFGADPCIGTVASFRPDGFFEWEKPTREAWRFSLSADKPLGFAGLWDAWKDPRDGSWLQSFSIITVPANALLSGIHDRMPAILYPHEFDRWLDRAVVERAPTNPLRPFETNHM